MPVAMTELLHEDLVLTDVDVDSKEELIRTMAALAIEKGYAVDGYAEDVIAREQEFPTGLPVQVMKVAVPHATTQEHVLKAAIVVARLARPVMFTEMGTFDVECPVEMAFMLVAKGDKDHLAVLQQLIMMFAEPDKMVELKKAEQPAEIIKAVLDLI